jgi:hypothetical protein
MPEGDEREVVVCQGKKQRAGFRFSRKEGRVAVERIELELESQTLERARHLAEARRCTVEQLLKEMIEHLGATRPTVDVFLGMLAQEPELINQVVESTMQAREDHPLRQTGG